jgi:membrane protease YdiL (CAAX protease family)
MQPVPQTSPPAAFDPAPATAWAPLYAPLALIAGFGASVFAGAFVALIAALTGSSLAHPPSSVELISTLFQDVLLVASAVFFAARVGRPRPAQFGLRATRVARAAGFLALGYVAFLIFSSIWESLLHLDDKEHVVQQLGANDGALALVAVVALTCVVAPICEEFFFRGFFFAALFNWRGPWTAAVLTGAVFGAIHAGSAPAGDLVPLGFFGFALCVIRWRTGSLYPCIALHALNNCVAFGVSEHWLGGQIAILVVLSGLGVAATLLLVARVDGAQ